jgi:cytochrome c oxidase subunit I
VVSSIGAYIAFAAAIFFVYICWRTFAAGAKAEANPWGVGADTLEWTVSSPPPLHSFDKIPVIGPLPGHAAE